MDKIIKCIELFAEDISPGLSLGKGGGGEGEWEGEEGEVRGRRRG